MKEPKVKIHYHSPYPGDQETIYWETSEPYVCGCCPSDFVHACSMPKSHRCNDKCRAKEKKYLKEFKSKANFDEGYENEKLINKTIENAKKWFAENYKPNEQTSNKEGLVMLTEKEKGLLEKTKEAIKNGTMKTVPISVAIKNQKKRIEKLEKEK
jgi:lysyl-tRNA synthetase class I